MINFFQKTFSKIYSFVKNLIRPRSSNEDAKRQEIILNIILLFSLSAFIIINLIRLLDIFIYKQNGGLPLIATISIMLFFVLLLSLSKRGFLKTASLLLIITFSIPMFYSFLIWGIDLSASLILSVLIIILTGILFGEKSILLVTLIISTFLIIISHQHAQGVLPVDSTWRSQNADMADAIAYSSLLMIISGVIWLFCREISKSLKRARSSEKALKEERDSLEITVEKRTKELLALEEEKIRQLYRFAEFGRLSSGIFHDLINPLSAVSLNLEQVNNENGRRIESAKGYLSQALIATRKMEGLIAGIKKQISREENIEAFSLNQEISQSLEILTYKARHVGVTLKFSAAPELKLIGSALKFGQVITNLVANAIEACEKSDYKEVIISLHEKENDIILKVIDSGSGIAPENITKIFQPFFSTKKSTGQGLGIGLSLTKEILEKDFKGSISVSNNTDGGASFLIKLPRKQPLSSI